MRIRTNIVINDDVIGELKALTGLRTRTAVVDLALRELLIQLRRRALLTMRRKGLWTGNLAARRRTRCFPA